MRSKSYGDLFEDVFFKLCRLSGVAITRIPDGCRTVGRNKIFRVKSPWDWVVSYAGKTALLDTKTHESHLFSHSAITEHQARELAQHGRMGIITGYVIWLRKTNSVFFMPALKLVELMEETGSFSEHHGDAVRLGTINEFNIKFLFLGGNNNLFS